MDAAREQMSRHRPTRWPRTGHPSTAGSHAVTTPLAARSITEFRRRRPWSCPCVRARVPAPAQGMSRGLGDPHAAPVPHPGCMDHRMPVVPGRAAPPAPTDPRAERHRAWARRSSAGAPCRGCVAGQRPAGSPRRHCRFVSGPTGPTQAGWRFAFPGAGERGQTHFRRGRRRVPSASCDRSSPQGIATRSRRARLQHGVRFLLHGIGGFTDCTCPQKVRACLRPGSTAFAPVTDAAQQQELAATLSKS